MYLEKELLLAQSLARQAGAIALAEQGNLTVTQKPYGQGPVSNADIAIDRFICEGIKNYFPDDKIVSEEAFDETLACDFSGRTWFVDPIDGTSSYIERLKDFSVLIGLAIDGIPRMGVVFEPAPQSIWSGIFCPEPSQSFVQKIKGDESPKAINIAQKIPSPHGITLALSRHYRSKRQQDLISIIKPRHVIRKSSVGLKAMLILDGEADLYVTFSTRIKLWDTCAPAAIFSAAGGIIQPLNGGSLDFIRSITHGHPIIMANFLPNEALLFKIASLA